LSTDDCLAGYITQIPARVWKYGVGWVNWNVIVLSSGAETPRALYRPGSLAVSVGTAVLMTASAPLIMLIDVWYPPGLFGSSVR
jgi:hypothetical protein